MINESSLKFIKVYTFQGALTTKTGQEVNPIGERVSLDLGQQYHNILEEKTNLILPILDGLSYNHVEDILNECRETIKRYPIANPLKSLAVAITSFIVVFAP